MGGTPGLVGGKPVLVGGTTDLVGGTPALVGGTSGLVGGTPGLVSGTLVLMGEIPVFVSGTPVLTSGTPFIRLLVVLKKNPRVLFFSYVRPHLHFLASRINIFPQLSVCTDNVIILLVYLCSCGHLPLQPFHTHTQKKRSI